MRHRSLRNLTLVGAVVVVALSLVGTAAAKVKPSLGKERIIQISAQVAPMTPLDAATVTVTDADGKIVGTGRTVNAGAGQIAVSKGRLPFLLSTAGGTVRGKPFEGHLQAITSRTTRADGLLLVSFATTVAARYRALQGGKVKSIERRVYQRLGLSPQLGWMQVRYGTHTLRGATLMKRAEALGGYDVFVDDLVARLDDGRRFPGFRGTSPDRHPTYTSSSSTVRAASAAPCPANILPPSNAAQNAIVAQYGVYMAAGTATAMATSDPYTLLTGVAGMMFATQPGMTNSSVIMSVSSQLTCISQQLAQLKTTLNKLTQITALQPLQNCVSAIASRWTDYQTFISNAQNNPGNPAYTLSTQNANLLQWFPQVETMNSTICNGIINQTLFNANGGSTPAWPVVVANYESGTYLSSDSTALEPSSVESLQYFLQYYSTFMYQQAALETDYLNWQGLLQNANFVPSLQMKWGPPCFHAPSLSDLAANGQSTLFCQWQQNIINVWPGDVYTDEVASFKAGNSTNPNAISGLAISAVPGIFGISTTAYSKSPTSLTTNYLNGSNINKYDSRWNAANAFASFNNQPATTIGPPYQFYGARQALAAGAPSCNGNCDSDPVIGGYDVFKTFFNGWLNAIVNPATASSPATVSSTSSDAKGHVTYQILGADGEIESSSGPSACGVQSSTNSGGQTLYKYGYYTAHNAVYSPSPWTKNTGGTLGGGSKTVTPLIGTTTSGAATDGCQSTPPIAWLKSRPWLQGGAVPGAPVITQPAYSNVSTNATLTATNCPSSGCTWAITNSTTPAVPGWSPQTNSSVPQGLTLSPAGVLSWSGAKSGQTASVEVVAGAILPTQVVPGTSQMVYSLPVVLTVTAP